jgi:hypothetical protein
MLTSDTDASLRLNTSTLAHRCRRRGVHPIINRGTPFDVRYAPDSRRESGHRGTSALGHLRSVEIRAVDFCAKHCRFEEADLQIAIERVVSGIGAARTPALTHLYDLLGDKLSNGVVAINQVELAERTPTCGGCPLDALCPKIVSRIKIASQ